MLQIGADETVAFFGPLFAAFTPTGSAPTVSSDGASVTLGPIQLDDGDGLVAVLPGGPTADGGVLEPSVGPLIDLSVIVATPDGAEGVYFFDPATAFDALSAP